MRLDAGDGAEASNESALRSKIAGWLPQAR
jgi:hypothetical protein